MYYEKSRRIHGRRVAMKRRMGLYEEQRLLVELAIEYVGRRVVAMKRRMDLH
jgi:hypothetical protein